MVAGRPENKSEVRLAAGALGSVVATLAIVSGVVNILALTGSFYMLQVYDRVLSSRSVATLLALSLLAVGLYLFQGGLEVIRSQILVRLAGRLDRQLTKQAMTAAMRLRAYVGAQGSPLQPIRDVDAVRTYLSGQGPVAILDLPWMPLYLAFVFILHPVLGWITMFGAAFLLSVALLTERMMKKPGEALATAAKQRWAIAEACEQNSEALHAMGFGHRFLRRFQAANSEHLDANERLSDVVGGLSSVSRVFRMMLQSALLGIGAYLTIKGEMSAGAIIACSIAASRALAPIEVAIGNWRVFVAARQACTPARRGAGQPAREVAAADAAGPDPCAQRREHLGDGAGHANDDAQRRQLHRQGGHRAGGDRAERGRQVDAGARPDRGVAAGARARCASTERRSAAGRTRSSASTSATCRRTCSCSTAPSPRTSPASRSSPTARR